MTENAEGKTTGTTPGNQPICYGVVGLGRMGALHLDVLKTLEPRVKVCALSDTDPKRLRQAKKMFPAAEALTDYKNMAGRVEAVSICTPTETHCAIAEYFLENKIAALVEKPIASNLTEAEKILWASQATQTVSGPAGP